MPGLLAARAQMGTSLAFHIIFSVLGVGLPLLLCIAEGLAIWRKDPVWMTLARRWARAAAIVFAIGAVSGTIVEFELGLLWPTYIRFIGSVIGALFAFEGFAFFLEAIFLGLYLYGWDKLSPRVHWLCSFPLVIGGAASTMFIVTTNAWMNTPAGFVIKNGQINDINPWQAIFNPSTPYETIHMLLACYVATGFGIAMVYAISMLRGHRDEYRRKGLLLGMIIGAIFIPVQIASGDANARFLASAQPAKFAAMEAIFKTQAGPPLKIGGIADPQTGQVYFAIEIPHGDSLLVNYNLNSTIRGLDSFPVNDRPNPLPVHLSFDGMVGSGFFALLVAFVFWLLFFLRKRKLPENKLLLWGVAITGPLMYLAVELGWIVTEEGRQPWIIYNYLRVANAVTTAPGLDISFTVFSLVYIVLGVTLIVLLRRQARKPLPKMEWEHVASGPEYSGKYNQELNEDQRVGV